MCVRILDHVRDKMVEFQEATGHLYNLEATPAEGTTYRFAKEDRRRFPGILQAGTESNPYYTNSSQVPVGYTDDPFEAQEMQEELQTKYTGGTVLHLYMNERISSAAACKELVRRSLTAFRTPYITITPTFSICPVHGYLVGEHLTCDKCAELHPEAEPVECEVWTRVWATSVRCARSTSARRASTWSGRCSPRTPPVARPGRLAPECGQRLRGPATEKEG